MIRHRLIINGQFLSTETEDKVKELISAGKTIAALKEIRAATDCGLREAKSVHDRFKQEIGGYPKHKLVWEKKKDGFGSDCGYDGYIGKCFVPFFHVGYCAMLKEDRVMPYVVRCYIPGIKTYRTKTEQEAKDKAQETCDTLIKLLLDK